MALVEALVAATIVAIALLFLVGLLAHESRLTARAAAQREVLTLLEAALEGVRAGAVEAGTFTVPEPPFKPIPRQLGATLWITIAPVEGVPGVVEATAEVRYRVRGDLLRRSLTTRVWTPVP